MIAPELEVLARRAGVQPGYWDVAGTWREASEAALVAALAGLGLPVSSPLELDEASRWLERLSLATRVGPVVVSPAGARLTFELRHPVGAPERCAVLFEAEDGASVETVVELGSMAVLGAFEADGQELLVRRVETDIVPGLGRHRAVVTVAGSSSEIWVLAPPERLATLDSPRWGVFAPTYSFVPEGRPGRDHLGVGNLGDLDTLGLWLHQLGGSIVSTLPLLPTFLDDPFDPSPYAPLSRRWWSELHLDPHRLPGLDESPAARALLGSNRVAEAAAALAGGRYVDHRVAARLVREVLVAVAGDLESSRGRTASALAQHSERFEEVARYAEFRARVEASYRMDLPFEDARPDPEVMALHRYAQFAAETQIAEIAERFGSRGQLLSLDLPLGAHRDGYDVWTRPELFADGFGTGAPPDEFFTAGQDWGFPPPHPGRSRESGHADLVAALRHHLRHSRLLRIDHVMSIERLWWVPAGHSAADGVYVRYPTEELMAVIAIEAARSGAVIVGENLGTVTDEVNVTMGRWGMLGMYELQFETWQALGAGELRLPPVGSVASLNTHDMPTFAGWWNGRDVTRSAERGAIDASAVPGALAERVAEREALAAVLGRELGTALEAELAEVMAASLDWLGRSPAEVVLVSLDDLLGEAEPQNVPGTGRERPNWRRRFAEPLGEVVSSAALAEILAVLDAARRPDHGESVRP